MLRIQWDIVWRMEYEMLEGQIREANVELLDSLAQLRMLLRN